MPTDNLAVTNGAHTHATEPPPTRPASWDFHGQHELAWDKIEHELTSIATKATAVEIVGRSAQDDIHGEKLGDVFDMLASDIHGDVGRLKELLGLGKVVRS